MVKFGSRLKSIGLGLAAIGLANIPLFAPQAQALPPWCAQWAGWNCDPLYVRGTPEWNECFAFYYDECINSTIPGAAPGATKTSCLAARRTAVDLTKPV